MEEVYYRRQGRRYVPVQYYDPDILDSVPAGAHLIVKQPGSTMRRFEIDPNVAGMLAAGLLVRDRICDAIRQASALQPRQQPVTETQREAWLNLAQAFDQDVYTLTGPSAADIADATVQALQTEFDRLITNPSARDAFDQFLTLHCLTRE